MTDLELARAWRRGDRAAGEQLFERHYAAVARFFRNKVDDDAADDLVQKTFLACVEGLERFREQASFRTYLFAIAYRLLCRLYRARRRHPAPIDFDVVTVQALDPSPSAIVARRDEQRLLLEALRRLPFNYQVALELVYWESMTAADAAAVLEIPLGTAKTWIRRARQALTRTLGELSTSDELLRSTLSNLSDWARSLRDQLAPRAEDEPA
ncbi:MAG: RNA polymerase sigma factor [Myxococcales bacterium]|nr:RNA polymerase sigma factor [Myxococcales bacterium]